MAPDKEFEDNYTLFSEIRSLNEVGISPLMELEERFKVSRFSRSVRELLLQASDDDDEGFGSLDLDVGDDELGEVLEASEPDASEAAKEVDAGFEGGEGDGNVIGAIGKAEGKEVAERLGGVAAGGVWVKSPPLLLLCHGRAAISFVDTPPHPPFSLPCDHLSSLFQPRRLSISTDS
ncbi:hypothetical protein ACFX13_020587 [Malus domestica]